MHENEKKCEILGPYPSGGKIEEIINQGFQLNFPKNDDNIMRSLEM